MVCSPSNEVLRNTNVGQLYVVMVVLKGTERWLWELTAGPMSCLAFIGSYVEGRRTLFYDYTGSLVTNHVGSRVCVFCAGLRNSHLFGHG
ncbi:hypothetical protein Tco_0474794 [Tanacetum coccineum]